MTSINSKNCFPMNNGDEKPLLEREHETVIKKRTFTDQLTALRKVLKQPVIIYRNHVTDDDRYKAIKAKRPAIYKCICYKKKDIASMFEYKCQHYGNAIMNRDVLTDKEHLELLSQPLRINRIKPEPPIHCYFVKRYLPNLTPAIQRLAAPNPQQVRDTWKKYHHILQTRQLKNLAMTLCGEKKPIDSKKLKEMQKEERHLHRIRKIEIKRQTAKINRELCARKKRKIAQTIWELFEVMKCFLMTFHELELLEEHKPLSKLILMHLIKFSPYIPDERTREFLDKFLVNLANNLTIWITNFAKDFGFNLLVSDECDFDYPNDEKNKYKMPPKDRLPIADFVQLSETSIATVSSAEKSNKSKHE